MGPTIAMTFETPAAPALYRMMAWLSPGYPVGAFSYSHGLEYAVESGRVHDARSTLDWLEAVIRLGGARNDGVFLTSAHRAAAQGDRMALYEVAELAAAYSPTAELALETLSQGQAFLQTTQMAWPCSELDWLAHDWPGPYAYPVVVGTAAAGHGIAVDPMLLAYLHAFAANLVSAAVRLVPLGQSAGQQVTAALEPAVLEVAAGLGGARLDDVGTASLMVDYCSMRHETQYTRLFRS